MKKSKNLEILYFKALLEKAGLLQIFARIDEANFYVDNALKRVNSEYYRYSFLILKINLIVRKRVEFDEAKKIIKDLENTNISEFENLYYKLLLMKGSFFIYESKFKEGLKYFSNFLSRVKGNTWFEGAILNDMAICYFRMGLIDEAISNYKKALKRFLRNNNKMQMVSIYNNLAIIYLSKNDIENSQMALNNYLKISKQLGYLYGIANSYNHYGNIEMEKNNYEKALKYFKKYLSLNLKIANTQGITVSYASIGWAYENLKEYKRAYLNYQKYYKMADKINYIRGKALGLLYLGRINFLLKKYDEVLQALDSSEKLLKEMNDFKNLIDVYQNKYDFYINNKSYNSAKKMLRNALFYAKKINDTQLVKEINKKLKELFNN